MKLSIFKERMTMKTSSILVFLLINVAAFSQIRFDYQVAEIEPVQLIVTYSLRYQLDSTNPDFIRQEDMLLFLGKNTSKFIGKNMFRHDTITRNFRSMAELQSFLMDPNRPFPRISYKIFKNYPAGKITYIEHIPSNTFRSEEDLNMLDWELTEDTTTIHGLHSQKAICTYGGRKWIAWFSPEIPFSDGPYKFNGLPGLILKASDSEDHYIFEMVSIEQAEKALMIDMTEKDFVDVSKKDFLRAKNAFYNNIMIKAKEAGLSSEIQQKAARKTSERNNLIELKSH